MNLVNGYITKNNYFKWSEMACKDGAIEINEEVINFVKILDEFRKWYNRPISPNSWYRSKSHNENLLRQGLPASRNSVHLEGTAIDFSYPAEFKGFTKARQEEFRQNVKNKWIELCHKYGYAGGIGFYDWGFHIDNRKNNKNGTPLNQKTYQFWDYRKRS